MKYHSPIEVLLFQQGIAQTSTEVLLLQQGIVQTSTKDLPFLKGNALSSTEVLPFQGRIVKPSKIYMRIHQQSKMKIKNKIYHDQ